MTSDTDYIITTMRGFYPRPRARGTVRIGFAGHHSQAITRGQNQRPPQARYRASRRPWSASEPSPLPRIERRVNQERRPSFSRLRHCSREHLRLATMTLLRRRIFGTIIAIAPAIPLVVAEVVMQVSVGAASADQLPSESLG